MDTGGTPDATKTRELLLAAKDGDPEAFGALIDHHLPRIYAFVRLHMSEALRAREASADLVQSTCLELFSAFRDLRNHDEHSFRAWLYTAALNKIRERRRFHGRARRDVRRETRLTRRTWIEQEALMGYATICDPLGAAMAREHLELVERALDRLPAHYREVIVLARIVELPHSEIAVRLGKSVDAVRQTLVRALMKLGELVGVRDTRDEPRTR